MEQNFAAPPVPAPVDGQMAPPPPFNMDMSYMMYYDPSFYQHRFGYDPSFYQWYYAYYAALYNAAKNSTITGIPPGFDPQSCRSLYVGNLHEKVSEALLYDIFATLGPLESCKLIKDKSNGNSAGYGFIDYFDHHTAAIALQQFNGKTIYGFELKVNWAFANTRTEESTVLSKNHYHIFVGDLSPDIDDKTLYNAFAPFGSISDARVMWDQNTGRSRGYGFVAYKRKEDAQRALTEMNGEVLGSRAIRCNWANQKGQTGLPSGPEPLPGMPSSYSAAGPAVNNSGMDLSSVLAQAPSNNTTVYVGNVTAEISEHALRQVFNDYGIIEEIKTQPDKGFAFVRYGNHESAARAIVGAHGRMIGSRSIKCSWGKEKMNVLPPPMIQQPSNDYFGPRRY